METQLAIVRHFPTEVGLIQAEEKGYIAVLTADSLSITKCRNVTGEARKRSPNFYLQLSHIKYFKGKIRYPVGHCYRALPITYRGKEVFRDPMSHVIVDISEEVICDSDEESIHKIGTNYMKLTKRGQLQAVPPPALLTPRLRSTLP